MSVSSGSPESGKGAVIESGSPDLDQRHAYGVIDLHDTIWSFYVSMRTWYEGYAANEKPGESEFRSIPPLYMLLFPRLFEKSWGYDRLYPYAFDDWYSYHPYLKNFDMQNRHLYADSEAYQLCLETENRLRSVLLAQGTKVPRDEIVLGDNILKCTLQLIVSKRGGSSLRMNAAKCIARETELIIERLRLGSSVLDQAGDIPNHSTPIRQLALKYMEGCDYGSDAALLVLNVALLGITKEAELMVQNLRRGHHNSYDVYLSTEIRGFALDVLTTKLDVFTASAKMSACYSDDKAKFFAEIEADAEQRSWRHLVEYDPASEEGSGTESSEKKQLEEGMVHHMLPHDRETETFRNG